MSSGVTESGEYIEWYSITPNSPGVDTGLAAVQRRATDLTFLGTGRERTNLTFLGIERQGTCTSAPSADTISQAGQPLIAPEISASHSEMGIVPGRVRS